MEARSSCPSEEVLVGFVEGSIDQSSRRSTTTHLDECGDCREALAAMARLIAPTPSGHSRHERAEARRAAGLETADWQPGTQVARFEVTERIGRGGMGAVYAAHDPELNRKVALKVLRADLTGAPKELEARLRNEAAAMAKIDHRAVVTVYDVGVHDGSVFIAMEFVPGQTLARWLESRHAWREIVAKFIEAGHGLAAAHQAGLVHRDFKPENVLLTREGSARVADFGVARAAQKPQTQSKGPSDEGQSDEGQSDEGDLNASESSESSDLPLTVTGMLVGTPLYMSPEQLRGQAATAASDQFGFFVALYVALYAERPFPGNSVAELLDSIENQAPSHSSSSTKQVPRKLFEIVSRGLSADSTERFGSMDAALEALVDVQSRPKRKQRWAVGAIAVAGAGLALWMLARPTPSVCGGAAEEFDAAWNHGSRASMAIAFARADHSIAIDTAERVNQALDDYSKRWRVMHRDACEATAVHGHQTASQLDLRMRCLERRRGAVRATVDRLLVADRKVVARAVDAVNGLPRLNLCADLDALAAPVPMPSDEPTRRQIEALQGKVSTVEAHYASGSYQQGLELADKLIAEITPVGYRPLEAEAHYARAKVRSELGDHEGERADLEQAVLAGVAGRDDRVAAKTAIELIISVGHRLSDLAAAKVLERQAIAAVERAGSDDELVAMLRRAQAILAFGRGKGDKAEELFQALLTAAVDKYGADSAEVLRPLRGLSAVASQRQNGDAMLKINKRILAIQQKHLGDGHPDVSETIGQLSFAEYLRGRVDEALAYSEDAIARRKRYLGDRHPDVAALLGNASILYSSAGEQEKAVAAAREALEINEHALGREHRRTVSALSDVALLLEAEESYKEALTLQSEAVAGFSKLYPADHPTKKGALTTLALIELGSKDYAAALITATKAEEMQARLGDNAPPRGDLERILGEIYIGLDRPKDAVASLEQARALVGKRAGDTQVIWVESKLAMALYDSKLDRRRGAALAVKSEAAIRQSKPLTWLHAPLLAWMKARAIKPEQ